MRKSEIENAWEQIKECKLPKTYIIKSEEEYKDIKNRVFFAKKEIGDNWLSKDQKIQNRVKLHQYFGVALLNYDIEYGNLPI